MRLFILAVLAVAAIGAATFAARPVEASYAVCNDLSDPVLFDISVGQSTFDPRDANFSIEVEKNGFPKMRQVRFGFLLKNYSTGFEDNIRFKVKVRKDVGNAQPAGAEGGTYVMTTRNRFIDGHDGDVVAVRMNGKGQGTADTRTFVRLITESGSEVICVAKFQTNWHEWDVDIQQAAPLVPYSQSSLDFESGYAPATATNEPREEYTLKSSGATSTKVVDPETLLRARCPVGNGQINRDVVSGTKWRLWWSGVIEDESRVGPKMTFELPNDPSTFADWAQPGSCDKTFRST